jgi:hypothetical protein
MTPLQELQKQFARLDEEDAKRHRAESYSRGLTPSAGVRSNAVIQRRNGGVRHQFMNSIGGDSSNYR